MGIRDGYEKMILKEVWEITGEVFPQVVKIIHSLNVGGR